MANVRDFEYITAIAQYGSISKASEALFLSQPTLSKFLQRVEKEVGLPLFHRVGKKFVPTPAGEIYVARSKSILELEQQMRQELTDLATMQSGTIRLGTTSGRSIFIAQQVIPAFRQMYPRIRLILYSLGHSELIRSMQNNELDFALVNYVEDPASFRVIPTGEDELVLVAPQHSPLDDLAITCSGHRFPVVPVEHWKQLEFVLPPSTSYSHRLVQRYWDELRIQPRVVMEAYNLRVVLDAVRSGVGVSTFISVPLPPSNGIRYFSLDGTDLPKQKSCILCHRDVYYTEAQQALMQLIQDFYRYPESPA